MEMFKTLRLFGVVLIILSLILAFYLGSILISEYVPSLTSLVSFKVRYKILSASIYERNGTDIYLQLALHISNNLRPDMLRIAINGNTFTCAANNTGDYICYIALSDANVSNMTSIVLLANFSDDVSYSIREKIALMKEILDRITPEVTNVYCITTDNHTSYILLEMSSRYYYSGRLGIKMIYGNYTVMRTISVTVEPGSTSVYKVQSVCMNKPLEIIIYYPFNFTKTYVVMGR